MDVLYDDTVLRVMGIHERGQLAPSDVACIASIDTAHTLCTATPFPKDDVTNYPEALNYEKVLDNMNMWCQARSTGNPGGEKESYAKTLCVDLKRGIMGRAPWCKNYTVPVPLGNPGLGWWLALLLFLYPMRQP
jgi:hypothetical protein